MRNSPLLILAFGFSGFVGSVAANPDGYTMSSETGLPGSTAEVPVVATVATGDVQAWSVAVCHDPSVASVEAVELGDAVTSLVVEFSQVELYPGGFTAEVFLFPGDPLNVLPAGADYEIHAARYLLADTIGLSTPLEFCDASLSSTTNLLFTNEGLVSPCLNSGELVIAPQTYELCVVSNVEDVPIEVTPADINGLANGETLFQRIYSDNPVVIVTLTAPAIFEGKCFLRWELDGAQRPYQENPLFVTMNADHLAKAIYQVKTIGCEAIIAKMIEILEDCFKDTPPPQNIAGRTLGPGAREIIRCLKKMNHPSHNNIKKAALENGPTSWVNAQASGDSTAVCRDADLITLNQRRFPKEDCDPNFATYIATLFHEGTHVNQDWHRGAVGESQDELPAYMNGLRVREALADAIQIILDNRAAGRPDDENLRQCVPNDPSKGFGTFMNCKVAELILMRDRLRAAIRNDETRVARHAAVTGETIGLAGPPPSGLAEEFYASSDTTVDRLAFSVTISNNFRSSSLTQTSFATDPPSEDLLETNIARVLDLEIVNGMGGDEVLMVFGTTTGYAEGDLDSGVIKAYRDSDNDGFFDESSEVELIANQVGFQSASNVTRDPASGRFYVYDPILRTLQEFVDTAPLDGIPDSLSGVSIIPSAAEFLVDMAVAQFTAERLEARMRFGEVAAANFDIVIFADCDADGFYETVVRGSPSQLEERAPTACTQPFIGNTTIGLFGSPEHTLALDEVASDGSFLQELATGTVPAGRNEVFLNLPFPLADGMFLQARDHENGLTTGPFETIPPTPTVYSPDVTSGPLGGGTVITYTGEHLTTLAAVRYDGNDGDLVSQSSTTVVVETPPSVLGGYVAVQFVPESGDPYPVTSFTYEDPSPAPPLANAGRERSVTLSRGIAETILDGSGSIPGGAGPITEYVWTGDFVGGIAFGVMPTVTFTTAGDHVVVLVVGDDGDDPSLPATTVVHVSRAGGGPEFMRGDADGNGELNALVDGLFVLNYGFVPGSDLPPCLEAADADGNGVLNFLPDALFIFNYGFIPGSAAPPPPTPPNCGADPDPVTSLGCDLAPCP